MIHYQLRCTSGHGFESWFRSIAAFEAQSRGGLIECPQCGTASVSRALMAPAITSGAQARPLDAPADPPAAAASPPAPSVTPSAVPSAAPSASPAPSAAGMPPALRAALQKLRSEVERHCDPVGDRFADEARAIHRGESPVRGIYGESTPEQAEALADEGIEVARIPWVPRADG